MWLSAGKDMCLWFGGGCSKFHSLEEHVDQVGLGQMGLVCLT